MEDLEVIKPVNSVLLLNLKIKELRFPLIRYQEDNQHWTCFGLGWAITLKFHGLLTWVQIFSLELKMTLNGKFSCCGLYEINSCQDLVRSNTVVKLLRSTSFFCLVWFILSDVRVLWHLELRVKVFFQLVISKSKWKCFIFRDMSFPF